MLFTDELDVVLPELLQREIFLCVFEEDGLPIGVYLAVKITLTRLQDVAET